MIVPEGGMPKRFVIVDVFAEKRYCGNQLAIVRADGSETDQDLQAIAQEFGFSETVFVFPQGAAAAGGPQPRHRVRIFTPGEELPFAGHPTLGAAWVLRYPSLLQSGSHAGAGSTTGPDGIAREIILDENVGPIRTWFETDSEDSVVWMQQNPPEFGRTFDPAATAAALGLDEAHVDPRLPVQQVSTGIPFVIVPLRSLDAVSRARAEIDLLPDLFGANTTVPVFLFATEAEERDHDIRARMFAPQYRIVEDPATGSANGCLAGYLVEHRVLGSGRVQVTVEQGYEMGRPSVLYLDAGRTDESDRAPEIGAANAGAGDASMSIRVGGRVRLVATGELF